MGTHRRARKWAGAGRRVSQAKSGDAGTGGGRMKRKDFPHMAKQTHEVFYPTTSTSKRYQRLGIQGQNLRGGSSRSEYQEG